METSTSIGRGRCKIRRIGGIKSSIFSTGASTISYEIAFLNGSEETPRPGSMGGSSLRGLSIKDSVNKQALPRGNPTV